MSRIYGGGGKLVIFKYFICNTNQQVLGINISNYSILNLMSNLILWKNNLNRNEESIGQIHPV